MINIDKITPLKLYKNSPIRPILNKDDKLKYSCIMVLGNGVNSSLNTILNKNLFTPNGNLFQSYYFEYNLIYYIREGMIELDELVDILNEVAEKDLPETSTSSTNFRNPTKPRIKSKDVDGYKVKPTKKTTNMLRDPKSLMRHLRYDMRRGKYKLNTLKSGRNNVGANINNPKGLEKTKELLTQGKRKEINRKKREEWIEKNLKNKDKEDVNEQVSYNVAYKDDKSLSYKNDDMFILDEAGSSTIIRNLLYPDRIKSNAQVLKLYKEIKSQSNGRIRYTFTDINKYRGKNIYYDLSYYTQSFFKNNRYSTIKAMGIYNDILTMQLDNNKLTEAGYVNKVLVIPVNDWVTTKEDTIYTKNLNPISIIIRHLVKRDKNFFGKFDFPVLFTSGDLYFMADFTNPKCDYAKIKTLIYKLMKLAPIKQDEVLENIDDKIIEDIDEIEKIVPIKSTPKETSSSNENPIAKKQSADVNKTPMTAVRPSSGNTKVGGVNKKDEVKVGLTLEDKTTGAEKPVLVSKKDAVKVVEKDLYKQLDKKAKAKEDETEWTDEDEMHVFRTVQKLEDLQDTRVKTSTVRSKRMDNLIAAYPAITLGNHTVKEYLDNSKEIKELPTTSLNIDSVNDEWKNLKFTNFEKVYDINADIVKILKSLSENKEYPIFVRDINKEDISSSQDYIERYTVDIEDINGKRSKLKFTLPIMIDNHFMMLKGNKKTLQKQIAPIPVCKIDEESSQITTNYMKTTLSIFGADGKSFLVTDTVLKLLNKLTDDPSLKVKTGDSKSFYKGRPRPIDFLDLAAYYNEIRIGNKMVYDFDINRLMKLFPDSPMETDASYIVGYSLLNNKKTPVYYDYDDHGRTFSERVGLSLLEYGSPAVGEELNNLNNRNIICKYSRVRILQVNIPTIILCGFYEGLEATLIKANVQYELHETRPKKNYIKFKDCYLTYTETYESGMLLHGLAALPCKDYTLSDMNNRLPYLNYINDNSMGAKVDGLLNFKDLMMDPITIECCKKYNLPEDFTSLLIYASNLLVDNKYVIHTDMNGRRIRSTEIISGYTYLAIAKAYQEYANQLRRGRKVPFTMKESAVIDLIMVDPTFSDMPLLNDLQIFEASNAISYKGLSGMNNDRSYSLDKRTFDPTMTNIISGMSTGFAGNVGINRQLTIDPNVETNKGFTKTTDDAGSADKGVTKTFSMTEAIAPYGTTRNDPMRSAMNFIQTSNHSMRVTKGSPALVTTGADQALPYLSDNTFSYKAKLAGKVISISNDAMVVEYKDSTRDMIDMRNKMLKNSNGGFYTSSKLSTNLKVGQTFKDGQILAYDKNMYSGDMMLGDNISYKVGTLSKLAILNTSEGFEDSAVISEILSEQMASDVVEIKKVTLSKNTNILNMVKVGDLIFEGDPLIVFQDAGDEEYVAQLMKSVSTDKDAEGVGSTPILSKVTGVVKDIKVYRTVDYSEMTSSLARVVRRVEQPQKLMYAEAVKNGVSMPYQYKVETLPVEGKLKKAKDSVLFEFYLEYHDKMGIGDKLIYLDAVKGVVQRVIPKGEEPTSEFRPEEKIHTMVSKGSLDARMVTSIKLVGGINKILIELDRSIKEELGIPWKNVDELGE